jgi:fatty-acyl-CoA synthase
MMRAVTHTVFDRALARTRELHFWHSKTAIDTWPAANLIGLASACAARFSAAGINAGDRVAICLPTSPEKVACIIASWGCGATVIVLPYTAQASVDKSKPSKLGDILHLVKPQLLVHDEYMPYSAAASAPQRLTRHDLAEDMAVLATNALTASRTFPTTPGLHEPALIQLTSGSTGLPKGVQLTHGQIAANCAAVQQCVHMNEQDHAVSWLPINHDMGLNAITIPLWSNAALTLMPPERFVRSPMTLLEAISKQRGTVSPNPAFAYTLLSKYAGRFKPGDIDLSCWRYAWAGAEPVFDKHLRAFNDAYAPHGLRNTVLKPAFGMAEAVVAVTCDLPDRPYLTLHVDAALFRQEKRIKAMPPSSPGTLAFVSNGPPLANMAVKIVDAQGLDLGEAAEGRLMISGASVATGYLNGVDSEHFYEGGWFDTGDLGFLVDGELYISGRAKDLIIRGGVNASPQHVEWAVEQFLELRPGQVAAFSVIDTLTAKEEVVVIGKRMAAALIAEQKASIARVSAEQAGVQIDRVVFTASAKLPKTTSGKVQRALARQMYLNRDFDETDDETELETR